MDIFKIKNLLNKDLTPKNTKREIEHQVENYHNLGFLKSARGIAAWLLIFYVFITAIDTFQGGRSINDLILYLVIYIPLAILIYKGKRWAIVATIFIWTVDRLYIFIQTNNLLGLVLWFLILTSLIQAGNVENSRHKKYLQN